MFNFGEDIGIDLGTASVLVYVKNKGIVLNEPSVVALDTNTNRVIDVGSDAWAMLGRTPGNIRAIRPMKEGVIADYEVTEKMLRYFIHKAMRKHQFFKPRVMVGIPSGVTSVEERAVRQASIAAGAKQCFLIEEPLAAALGAGLDIAAPAGSMVVDIGGGTTDVAVLSLGGIVISKSVRIGGDKLDESLVRYMRRYHNIMIGDRTAEDMKMEIGSAWPKAKDNVAAEIRGRDLVSGLPKNIIVTSDEAHEAMKEQIDAIVAASKEVLERTPPELAADIMDKGIVLTGGGALLHGLDLLLIEETQLPVHVAENPVQSVALGTAKALVNLDLLESARSFNRTSRQRV
ncbi:MAG: rod shape-determining protein MreB [Clostridiales bacterium]|nr:rod shape-determining protein MreB [Clostridiales bacterium]